MLTALCTYIYFIIFSEKELMILNYNFYDIDLMIEPKKSFLKASVNMKYIVKENNVKELNFYIHKDLQVESITCDGMMNFKVGKNIENWSPFILESKKITLKFDSNLIKESELDIIFHYSGNIHLVTQYKINRITESWLELGIYAPWYPLSEHIDNSLYKVKIQIDSNYKILSSGNTSKHKGIWEIVQNQPSIDCVIIGSNNFENSTDAKNQSNINTYYMDNELAEVASRINYQASWLFKKFSETFGEIKNDGIDIFLAPRHDGGGYCRDNLIVLTTSVDGSIENNIKDASPEQQIKTFRFIAHELSHLWWNKAESTSWEDWLNESFAEYSSLMVTREFYGEKEFLRLINLYKEKTLNLPAIRGIDRSDQNAFNVLYAKGAVLLHQLQIMIGAERFKELLKNIHRKKIKNTLDFMDELTSLTSEETSNKFSKLLDL